MAHCGMCKVASAPLLLLLLLLVVAGPAGASVPGNGTGFITRSGSQFMLDGSPFYFNGWTTYWLMVSGADPDPVKRLSVDQLLNLGASLGLTVCRTWASNDGTRYRGLQTAPGVFSEATFRGLDYVIEAARRANVRLILPLVNNWDDYGLGKQQYIDWRLNGTQTGEIATLTLAEQVESGELFFTDPTIRGWYKGFVRAVLTRNNSLSGITYKDDGTIFGWELMNEPRVNDTTGNTLQAWIAEMSAYVKSIDPNHMLGVGGEGFYGASTPDALSSNPDNCTSTDYLAGGIARSLSPVPSVLGSNVTDGNSTTWTGCWATSTGNDYVRNTLTPGIDYGTFHGFIDEWVEDNMTADAKLAFFQSWVASHITFSNVTEKPVILEDFGAKNRTLRQSFYAAAYNATYTSYISGASGAGDTFWWLTLPGINAEEPYAVLANDSTLVSLIATQSQRIQVGVISESSLNVTTGGDNITSTSVPGSLCCTAQGYCGTTSVFCLPPNCVIGPCWPTPTLPATVTPTPVPKNAMAGAIGRRVACQSSKVLLVFTVTASLLWFGALSV